MGLGGFFKKIAGPALGLGAGIATLNPAVGLAVASGVNASFKQGEANDISREGLDIARADAAARAPLREEFTSRALAPIQGARNLSDVFQASGSNAFAPPTRSSLADIQAPSEITTPPIAEPQPTSSRGGIRGGLDRARGMMAPGGRVDELRDQASAFARERLGRGGRIEELRDRANAFPQGRGR